jgi:hypothetical protein
MLPRRYDFADQALFSQHLHHEGVITQVSVRDTAEHIIECCGSIDDVMYIKVVGALHQLMVPAEDGISLEAWRALPFSCAASYPDKVPRGLFFARLWLHSTAFLFGDEVLSLRDLEKDCAVLSMLPSSRDDAIEWPSSIEKKALREHLTSQLGDLELFAESFVEAVCYVYNEATKLHNPAVEWERIGRGSHSVFDGVVEFDRYVFVSAYMGLCQLSEVRGPPLLALLVCEWQMDEGLPCSRCPNGWLLCGASREG